MPHSTATATLTAQPATNLCHQPQSGGRRGPAAPPAPTHGLAAISQPPGPQLAATTAGALSPSTNTRPCPALMCPGSVLSPSACWSPAAHHKQHLTGSSGQHHAVAVPMWGEPRIRDSRGLLRAAPRDSAASLKSLSEPLHPEQSENKAFQVCLEKASCFCPSNGPNQHIWREKGHAHCLQSSPGGGSGSGSLQKHCCSTTPLQSWETQTFPLKHQFQMSLRLKYTFDTFLLVIKERGNIVKTAN